MENVPLGQKSLFAIIRRSKGRLGRLLWRRCLTNGGSSRRVRSSESRRRSHSGGISPGGNWGACLGGLHGSCTAGV